VSVQEEIFLNSCSVIKSIENHGKSATDPIFCLNMYRLSGSVVLLFLACFLSEFYSHFPVTSFQKIS